MVIPWATTVPATRVATRSRLAPATVNAGGGADTLFFAGSQLGSTTLTTTPTSAETLNYLGYMGGGINLDMSHNGTQTVSGTATLTVDNANAIVAVVGTPYADTIKGNSSNDTIIGAGGSDSIVAGSGNDYLQGDITQVVLLDFDTATQVGDHVYT